MNTEKRNSLFVVAYFAMGLFGGWLLGSIAPVKGLYPTNIKAEYYLELRKDGSVIVENTYGNSYVCPTLENLPDVLLKDNL